MIISSLICSKHIEINKRLKYFRQVCQTQHGVVIYIAWFERTFETELCVFHVILDNAFRYSSSSSSALTYATTDARRDEMFIEAHQRRHATHLRTSKHDVESNALMDMTSRKILSFKIDFASNGQDGTLTLQTQSLG